MSYSSPLSMELGVAPGSETGAMVEPGSCLRVDLENP